MTQIDPPAAPNQGAPSSPPLQSRPVPNLQEMYDILVGGNWIILSSGAPAARTPAPSLRSRTDPSHLTLRDLYDLLIGGKWILVGGLLLGLAIGMFVSFIAEPMYRTYGLVQVESGGSNLDATLKQMTGIDSSRPETNAEVLKLKSHKVLNLVAQALDMDIWCRPQYFPVIGNAIARGVTPGVPAPAPLGLTHYAWGGEVIRITAFDVPVEWLNKVFSLVTTEQGYILQDRGVTVLSGHVGERANGKVPLGLISLYVQQLVARPGTTFLVAHRSIDSVVPALSAGLTVASAGQPHERDSGVITMSFESPDPVVATAVIDKVEDVFLQQNVEKRSAGAAQTLKFLEAQLPQLKENVAVAESKLNHFQLQKGSVDIAKETELALTQAVSLETEHEKLVQQRESALRLYTHDHPVVLELEGQIQEIEKSQAMVRKQVERLPETQQEILSLMRDLQVNTQLYTTLLNSSQELQIAKAGTVGSVSIIDRAVFPTSPISPNVKQIMMIAVFLGVVLAIAWLLGTRLFLRGVDRPQELERALGLVTYATIPYSAAQRRLGLRRRPSKGTVNLLATQDATDPSIEALRGLRTALQFAMIESPNNRIMFTGPSSGLGKTFVSLNFAAVVAMSGARVVVIDADMRRGRLQLALGGRLTPGLSDYVVGKCDLAEVIQSGAVTNLDLIAGGTRPPNPAEILMSTRFEELLEHVSKAYDYVFIDTPPALPVTDAAIIGRRVGTTLIVLKAGEHSISVVEETLRRLAQSGVQVKGAVFNQVGARVGSYGYGRYGYSYGYSSSSSESI